MKKPHYIPPSTELAIPEQEKIIPKPTKNEIISAMVEIARKKFLQQRDFVKAEYAAFKAKNAEAARKIIRKELSTIELNVEPYSQCIHVNVYLNQGFDFAHLSREDQRLRRELRVEFDEKGIRALLRENLLGKTEYEGRIKMLLDDPETAAHLEAVLLSLTKPAIQNS